MNQTVVYFAHSPISYHLARLHSLVDKGPRVFVSARHYQYPESSLHFSDDQLSSREAVLEFAQSIGSMLRQARDRGPIRLYVPHTASAMTRLLVYSGYVDTVFLLEEGLIYYRDDAAQVSFGPFDYIKTLGLDEVDLEFISNALRIDRSGVRSALEGQFPLFDQASGKVRGALVTQHNSLSALPWRGDLQIEVVPLRPIPLKTSLSNAVLVFLPYHQTIPGASSETIGEQAMAQREIVSCLLDKFERVCLSIHPSDFQRSEQVKALYGGMERVSFVDEEQPLCPEWETPYMGELSCLPFRGFLTQGSSASVYALRIFGEFALVDHLVVHWLAEKTLKLSVSLKQKEAEVHSLMNSNSWKITAPLRAGLRVFKR